MTKSKKSQDPYNLDPRFEGVVATLCCGKPKFYSKIGVHLNTELMALEPAKLAIKAVNEYIRENKNPPSSLKIVAQKLRSWINKGKVTDNEVAAVMDMFDNAEDDLPNEQDVVNEIRPILQRGVHYNLIETAIDQLGKHGDMNVVRNMIDKADRIGASNITIGTSIESNEAFEEVAKLRNLSRTPTGVMELDFELGGGMERGSLWTFLGDTGDGKSIMLNHIAATQWINGLNIAVATLELDKSWWLARLMANITGTSIDSVINGSFNETKRVLKELSKGFGKLRVEYFTPEATTFEDIVEFVDQVENEEGEEVDSLIIDYGDLLVLPEGQQTNSEYINMKKVWRRHRTWTNERNKYSSSASQPRRSGERGKRKRLTINDFADSHNKARVTDGAVSLMVSGEGDERKVEFDIIKNRFGPAKIHIGPLDTQFPIGRITSVVREYEQNYRSKDKSKKQKDLFS